MLPFQADGRSVLLLFAGALMYIGGRKCRAAQPAPLTIKRVCSNTKNKSNFADENKVGQDLYGMELIMETLHDQH